MTPEKNQQLIEASLHRMAARVLEYPIDQREAAYKLMRENMVIDSEKFGINKRDYIEFEQKYMTWLRALVDMIEKSGGAKGGHA